MLPYIDDIDDLAADIFGNHGRDGDAPCAQCGWIHHLDELDDRGACPRCAAE